MNRDDHLNANTQAVFQEMIDAGCVVMTPIAFITAIGAIGYRVGSINSFNYVNTSNDKSYKARSIAIVDKATGLSFANTQANRDNLQALQTLRMDTVIIHSGRIWEL